jgi:hypothetical protein
VPSVCCPARQLVRHTSQIGTPTDSRVGLSLTGAAVNDMGFEWHCQDGLLANMGRVVQEYRDTRGIQPLRLLVHGNDALAKEALASAISAEYKLPLITVRRFSVLLRARVCPVHVSSCAGAY